jgi:hypothetical protein
VGDVLAAAEQKGLNHPIGRGFSCRAAYFEPRVVGTCDVAVHALCGVWVCAASWWWVVVVGAYVAPY